MCLATKLRQVIERSAVPGNVRFRAVLGLSLAGLWCPLRVVHCHRKLSRSRALESTASVDSVGTDLWLLSDDRSTFIAGRRCRHPDLVIQVAR